jgi:light-regulated signal transduction histidine kinase (bacteriophytochrome)
MSPEEIACALTPLLQLQQRQHDAYRKTQRGKKPAGAGVGLPLSRMLAEAHGGQLEVESRAGSGTTVHVTLPAERVLAAAVAVKRVKGLRLEPAAVSVQAA